MFFRVFNLIFLESFVFLVIIYFSFNDFKMHSYFLKKDNYLLENKKFELLAIERNLNKFFSEHKINSTNALMHLVDLSKSHYFSLDLLCFISRLSEGVRLTNLSYSKESLFLFGLVSSYEDLSVFKDKFLANKRFSEFSVVDFKESDSGYIFSVSFHIDSKVDRFA